MLPRTYQNSFEGENGDKLLKETWLIELTQATEDFIMDSISQAQDVHYCQHQSLDIITAKEKYQRSS